MGKPSRESIKNHIIEAIGFLQSMDTIEDGKSFDSQNRLAAYHGCFGYEPGQISGDAYRGC